MFKSCGLAPGGSRLRFLPTRALCAPRAPRSFATTVHVSRDSRPEFPRQPGRFTESRDHKPPAIETNELPHDDLQAQTVPGSLSIEQDVHLGREFDRGNEVTNNDQDKLKVEWSDRRKESKLDAKIRAPQDFHSQLHPTLLTNVMRRRPLLRGMPVYDSTFDAVRSGRDLFIKTPGRGRSLQYLLPLAHSILEHGVWGPKPELKSNGHRPARPLQVLIICPTLEDANKVQAMGMRLLKSNGAGLEMVVLDKPISSKSTKYRTPGYNILISTPEILLSWLSLGHAKRLLVQLLQDVKTLVVDGEASSLRHRSIRELLDGVMEEFSLPGEIQRVVISDELDPKLDSRLTEVLLPGDYEFHHEPRLDEIQALRNEAWLDKIKERKKKRKKRARDNKMTRPMDQPRLKKKKILNEPYFGT